MLRLEPFRAEGTETLSTALWHLKKEKELCSLATQVREGSMRRGCYSRPQLVSVTAQLLCGCCAAYAPCVCVEGWGLCGVELTSSHIRIKKHQTTHLYYSELTHALII